MINVSDIKTIRTLLRERPAVAILTHSNPDGDAIGSSLALGMYLRKLDIPAAHLRKRVADAGFIERNIRFRYFVCYALFIRFVVAGLQVGELFF